jgi:hypothetical protein
VNLLRLLDCLVFTVFFMVQSVQSGAVFFMVQSVQSGVWTGPGLQHEVQSAWLTWTDQSSGERGLDGLQATQAPELHTSKLWNNMDHTWSLVGICGLRKKAKDFIVGWTKELPMP